jgi:HAD superfamily hydrolase (TIGR01509 family)
MSTSKVQAIIFDCFGVLRPDMLELNYRKFGGDPEKDAQFIHDTMLASNRGLIPRSAPVYAERLGISDKEWIAAFDNQENDQELLDYILQLKQMYKIGLLSNASAGRMQEIFGKEELLSHFDAVVASGEIGYAKPEAQAYEIIADRLGVRLDECIFTDDREEYCEGARAVGMQAILYQNFAQFRRELESLLK